MVTRVFINHRLMLKVIPVSITTRKLLERGARTSKVRSLVGKQIYAYQIQMQMNVGEQGVE